MVILIGGYMIVLFVLLLLEGVIAKVQWEGLEVWRCPLCIET